MVGNIHINASVWVTFCFHSFFFSSGKEETGDEEECDNGNVSLPTIKTRLSALPFLLDVICHQKLNFLFASVHPFHPVRYL